MKVYSTFYLQNFAETWRDVDNIHRTDLGIFETLKKAKKAVYDNVNYVAIEIIKEKRFIQIPKWFKVTDKRYPNSICFRDSGSWAPTYMIQKIEIK